jgi:hypothetical protein
MFRTIALVSALVCAGAVGCAKGKHDGTSCDAVGANFLALSDRQLADAEKTGGVDAKTRAAVETHVPAMRDSMVRACKESGWSAESRACFAAASDDAAMMSCYQTLAPEQQALLEKGFTQPAKK